MEKDKSQSPTPSTFVIKRKCTFKNPFRKSNLRTYSIKKLQSPNGDLTDYFNYGFNEDTMKIYMNVVNMMSRALDQQKAQQYFDEPTQLLRLNDQIPMDLGGFGKFIDQEVFKNDFIQNDQKLFNSFLFQNFNAYSSLKQYPMVEFVRAMYPQKDIIAEHEGYDEEKSRESSEVGLLEKMMEKICQNLEAKYEETIIQLISEEKNRPQFQSTLEVKGSLEILEEDKPSFSSPNPENGILIQKQGKIRRRSFSSRRSSSSLSSSSSSSSSNTSEEQRRKRRHKREKRKKTKKRHTSKSHKSKSTSKSRFNQKESEGEKPRHKKKKSKHSQRREQYKHRRDKYWHGRRKTKKIQK